MNMVTVATFHERDKASPLRQRLENAGIYARIHDESKYEWLWFVTRPLAGIRLKVGKNDFGWARELVRAWDSTEDVLRDGVRCPQCGYSRIEYPQFTRKFLMPNLVGLASVIGIFEKEYFCQDCDHTWPVKSLARWPRKHGSPYYFIEDVPQAIAPSGSNARI